MKDEVKALYAAVILSIVVIFATNWFFPKKNVPLEQKTEQQAEVVAPKESVKMATDEELMPEKVEQTLSLETALSADERIQIVNDNVEGSIRVKGARFDQLSLSKYKQTLENSSPDVNLLTPAKTDAPYYAEFGWLSTDKGMRLPDENTMWKVKGGSLTPQTPVMLEWSNGQGLKFSRKISIDDNYMFTIEQIVENNSGKNVSLYPYGLISRGLDADNLASSVVHEGITGVINGTLEEVKLKSLTEKNSRKNFKTDGGWVGFSDRYWFTALILNDNQENLVKVAKAGKNKYQADFVGEPVVIDSGSVGSASNRFYAGAKEIKLLDKYTRQLSISKFDLAVDFGWYYFLTKPFFYILDFLYHFIGNMGWAILLFAALLRAAMFPIANKSYENMSKMKKVQPKIQELQARYKDDRVKLQQEMMNLYRKEKINPASGCLPMLIQIPIFFSLYKVLNISIEIRHAPFIGWIKDLSAPDPLTISTWSHLSVPAFIDIGIWPIVMGLTMYIQQKLNPKPANKDQARALAFMPLIFTFMLGHFASGLVIYWTLTNILSIIQQRVIMKKVGV